jgi:hypothetical protein
VRDADRLGPPARRLQDSATEWLYEAIEARSCILST